MFVAEINLSYFLFLISYSSYVLTLLIIFIICFLQPSLTTMYYLFFTQSHLFFLLLHLVSVILYSIEIDDFDDKTNSFFYMFISKISFVYILTHFSLCFFASLVLTSVILNTFQPSNTFIEIIAFFY